MKQKQCELCGQWYTPTSPNQKRCKKCQKLYYQQYQHHYNITHRQYRCQYMAQYYEDQQHHQQHLARVKANNMKYSGKSEIPSKCAFKGCTCTEGLKWYHVSYGGQYPHVVALCPQHHSQEMRKARARAKNKKCQKINIRIGGII